MKSITNPHVNDEGPIIYTYQHVCVLDVCSLDNCLNCPHGTLSLPSLPQPVSFYLPCLQSIPHLVFISSLLNSVLFFYFLQSFVLYCFFFFFFPLLPVSVKSFKLAVFPNSSQLFSSELHSSLFSAKATENSSFSCFSSLVLNYSWQLCNYREKKVSLVQARSCIFKTFYCQAFPKTSTVHMGTEILQACILTKFGKIFTP